MPEEKNILKPDTAENEALFKQVNQEVRKALVSPSNEPKIPWEDFQHNLQDKSITPLLERDEEGQIELNYRIETFNVDTFEQDRATVKGVDLSVHNEVLDKVATRGAIQQLIERENLNRELVQNVQSGRSIVIDYREQEPIFRIAENPDLAKQLNELPNDIALEIAQKNNSLVAEKTIQQELSFERELRSSEELGRNNGLKL